MRTPFRNLLLVFLIIIGTNCCISGQSDNQDYRIREYKLYFFKKCLNYSFNNNLFSEMLRNDSSEMNDFPLGINGYKEIDSLARSVKNQIIQDSISRVRRYFELSEDESKELTDGKRIIRLCLDYYESPKLDSFARSRYSN